MRYSIGTRQFRTKSDAKTYARDYANRVFAARLNQILDGQDLQFFLELMRGTSKDFGPEPTRQIRVVQNQRNPSQRETQWRNPPRNPDWDAFSTDKCIDGKSGSDAEHLREAMRNEIGDQMSAWRDRQDVLECGECKASADVQVDHHPVLFKDLAKDFCDEHPSVDLATTDERRGSVTMYRRFVSEETSTAWKAYHLRRTQTETMGLRLLCRTHNLEAYPSQRAESQALRSQCATK